MRSTEESNCLVGAMALSDNAGGQAHADAGVARAARPLVTRTVFGYRFVADAELDEVADQLFAPQPVDGRLPVVVTPNVDYLVRLTDPALNSLDEAIRRCRYILPDGQPIVWASRLLKTPLRRRLPGSSLFAIVWRRVVTERRPTVVIAPSERTAERLRAEYPSAVVVVPPRFDDEDPDALARVVASCRQAIEECAPEFVFVGISFPKQQRVTFTLLDDGVGAGAGTPLFLLIGAALEMHVGDVPRAPRWMQSAGLEWLFRFAREPRRLFGRYFVRDPRFAALLLRELRSHAGDHSDSRLGDDDRLDSP